MRRVPAVVAVVVGLALTVGVFAMSGFSKARSGENLIDDAQGSVSKTGIVRFRGDLEELKAAAGDLEKLFPAFAAALGLNDAQFEQKLRTEFPAITEVVDRGSEILGAIEKGVSNLEAHQADYEAADDIPLPGVPVTVMPWFVLATGIGLVALGAWCWRSSRRAPLVAIGVVGLVLVAFTFGAALPDKTKKAERLIDSLDISREVADRTREQFDTTIRGNKELSGLVRSFGEARQQTPEQSAASVAREFPRLARVLGNSRAFDRIEGEVRYREEHVEEFADVKDIPMQATAWAFVALGALLAAAAGVALIARRRAQ